MAVRKPNNTECKNPKIVQRKSASASKRPTTLGSITVRERHPSSQPPGLLAFTLTVIYKGLYILGITLLRRRLRYRRRLRQLLAQLQGSSYAAGTRFADVFRRYYNRFWQRVRAPFRQIRSTRRELAPLIREKRYRGEKYLPLYYDMALPVLKLIGKIISTIFNYLAPLAGLYILVTVIQAEVTKPMGLQVTYNGVELGYVENEYQFEQALQDVRDRMLGGSTLEAAEYVSGTPLYTLTEVEVGPDDDPDAIYTSTEELANAILLSHGGEIVQAFGLYIDDVFYGAVAEGDVLLAEMEKIKQSNRTGLPSGQEVDLQTIIDAELDDGGEAGSGEEEAGGGEEEEETGGESIIDAARSPTKLIVDEDVEFEKGIKVDWKYYPVSSMVPLANLSRLIHSEETVEETYEVVAGDSLSLISDKTGVSYDRLVEMNPWVEEDGLYEGDVLLTVAPRPFLSVKNIYTEISKETYDYEVIETPDPIFAQSFREVTQAGVPGTQLVTRKVTAVNGLIVDSQIEGTEIITEAVPEMVTVGVNLAPGGTSGGDDEDDGGNGNTPPPPDRPSTGEGFMWPAAGGRVTTGLYGYWNHTGADITGPGAGSPIYASMSGTVTIAKRTWVGYGHYIVIDHHNGYQTLYAHNSEIYVNVGDYVSQGQVIALMGRTGNATGNHLHFEVRQNGQIKNPVDYIGYSP